MELSWMCLISIRWSSTFHYLLSDGLVEQMGADEAKRAGEQYGDGAVIELVGMWWHADGAAG
jgi:hypothetical protein